MRNILSKIRAFMGEDDGPTAVEYAVMLVVVFVIAYASIELVGATTSASLSSSAKRLP